MSCRNRCTATCVPPASYAVTTAHSGPCAVSQLHAAYSGSISIQGYLLKHRPVTQLMGLFSQEWEMR